jgi:hypothetical protein
MHDTQGNTYNACMVALQIRDVPNEVRDILAEDAARRGQSLQAYLLELVKTQARRRCNSALIRSLRERSDGASLGPGEAAELIRRLREERDAHLMDVLSDRG